MEMYLKKLEESKKLFLQVKDILSDDKSTQEDRNKVQPMLEDAKRLKTEAMQLKEAADEAAKLGDQSGARGGDQSASGTGGPAKFKSLGDNLFHIALAGNSKYRGELHPALVGFNDPAEGTAPRPQNGKGNVWENEFSQKDLGESVGAQGGFLVAQEFRPELLAVPAPVDNIRSRATVIPMRSRTLAMPALVQSGTAAGAPHFFGGIQAQWTEEAQEKPQSDPSFRQIVLTAYKLVCYTRASDELLADSAVALAAFFSGPMGFAGAIKWQEEYAFLRGHGTGQPLGIINAPGTLIQPRLSTVGLDVADILGMVEQLFGEDPIWHISRSQMSRLMQLNGPAGHPSYIFMPSARDGVPSTLFGYPISWSDKMPAAGTKGDITLAAWRYYLIGDRQATTIDSTNIERFRNDQTSWRAVHRVDGRPWMDTPLTYQDGTTQVAPFVVLGDKTT